MSPAVARPAGQPGGTRVVVDSVVVVVVVVDSVVVVVVAAATAAPVRCILRCAPSAASTPRFPSYPGETNRCIAATASVQ